MNRDLLLNRIRTLTQPLEPISIQHPTKLQKLRDIRCIAFDFYGTMFISGVGDIGIDEDQRENSTTYFTESLKASGFKILNPDAGSKGRKFFEQKIKAHIAAARENGIDHPEPDVRAVWLEVLQELKAEECIAGAVTQSEAKRFGIEFEFRINNIWPVPQLDEVLSTLLEQEIQLGIISNSQFYTPIAFEAFLGKAPADYGFNPELLIWSFQTGYKKPSLDFYRLFIQAAEQEGLAPGQVLYVGNDIRKDIAPAKALGMKTALYTGDKRSIRHQTGELGQENFTPDVVVDDLPQLLQCLGD